MSSYASATTSRRVRIARSAGSKRFGPAAVRALSWAGRCSLIIGAEPAPENAYRPLGVIQEQPQARDRGPAHPRVCVTCAADESLSAPAYQRCGVLVGSGLLTVGTDPDAAEALMIDGLTADAHDQRDHRRPIGRGGGVSHGEQERQTGHRARIHVPLVMGGTVEAAEGLLPGLGVGQRHVVQPLRNIIGRPVGVPHGCPVDALQVVDHARYHAGQH
ncbi:hypothetical protein [Streptomyces erythrochromogenes]|uniref:hypothetical protein n=1 Tax=Streptomyces erythrochromogenes TaxID=285574 RepID=UPI0004CCF096|nr:hypothetical protein [Streptomyces erythrochromogenes]